MAYCKASNIPHFLVKKNLLDPLKKQNWKYVSLFWENTVHRAAGIIHMFSICMVYYIIWVHHIHHRTILFSGSRLDEVVERLVIIARNRMSDYRRDIIKGIASETPRMKKIREDHLKAEELSTDLVRPLANIKGYICQSSTEENVQYSIEEVPVAQRLCVNDPICGMRCRECQFCIHCYRCSCPTFFQRNIGSCKHIHLIGRLIQQTYFPRVW